MPSRVSETDAWQADTIVGQRFRDVAMTDVAAAVAKRTGDHSALAHTGRGGLLRVDPGPGSDHFGLVTRLDLSQIDESHLRQYT
ncbi:hypothetical protein ACFWYW_55985 [Nonomuraea sp. NPDC059023]|uniref:hypothetical protein n=1 Tax=unclassified Nonomuraea TaxID=2593643 RepID=UPI0036B192A9